MEVAELFGHLPIGDEDFTEKKYQRKSSADVLHNLCLQREKKILCDLIMKAMDIQILAHKCVIAAQSERIANMLTSEVSQPDRHGHVILDLTDTGCSPYQLRNIVDFMYGKPLTLRFSEVEEVLKAADFLMADEPKILCAECLLNNLKLSNCLDVWGKAVKYNVPVLECVCRQNAVARFHDTLMKIPETLNVDSDMMLHFIKEGLGRYCSHEDLRKFLREYVRIHPTASMNELCKAAKIDVNNQKENAVEYVGGRVSEVEQVLLLRLEERYLLFAFKGRKFYKLPNEMVLSKDWNILQLGINPSSEWAVIVNKEYSMKLKMINIFTGEVKNMPLIPAKKLESIASSAQRTGIQFECYKGEIFCIYACSLVVDPHNTTQPTDDGGSSNDRSSADSSQWHAAYIQRFDISKWKWKYVCTICEKQEKVQSIHFNTVAHDPENIYIFTVAARELWAYCFEMESRRVAVLAALSNTGDDIPTYSTINILGSRDKFFLEINGRMFIYGIISKTFSENKNEEIVKESFFPEDRGHRNYSGLSPLDGLAYYIQPTEMGVPELKAYDPQTKGVIDLSAPPCMDLPSSYSYREESFMTFKWVPSSLVKKLAEDSMLDRFNESLFTESVKRTVINKMEKEFKSKNQTLEKEASTHPLLYRYALM